MNNPTFLPIVMGSDIICSHAYHLEDPLKHGIIDLYNGNCSNLSIAELISTPNERDFFVIDTINQVYGFSTPNECCDLSIVEPDIITEEF